MRTVFLFLVLDFLAVFCVASNTLTVLDNYYFVLGDNRGDSVGGLSNPRFFTKARQMCFLPSTQPEIAP